MLPLGTVFGVKLGAHWSLLVAIAVSIWLLGAVDGTLGALGALGSVLAHELAHAFVAVRRGVRVAGVELRALGGQIAIEPSPEHELAIAVAGPIASGALTLAFVALSLATHSMLAIGLAAVNAIVFVSNALPILPLDGGRACRAWLAKGRDRVDATRAVAWLNVALAVFAIAFGVGVGAALEPMLGAPLVVTGGLIWMLGVLEVRRVQREATRASMMSELAFDPNDAPWAPR